MMNRFEKIPAKEKIINRGLLMIAVLQNDLNIIQIEYNCICY